MSVIAIIVMSLLLQSSTGNGLICSDYFILNETVCETRVVVH